ncbi:MAG: TIGR00266 family protein [Candidatus Micrarchaeia archaeon]
MVGNNMQSLNIYLDAGEEVYADSGHLINKASSITMTPRMTGGLFKAIERKATGATALLTVFRSNSPQAKLSIGSSIPGKILAIELEENETFSIEDNAFLAATSSLQFTIQTVSLGAAFFGGAGLVLQKYTGPGILFMHIVGDPIEYDINPTTPMEVDPGHIAGFSSGLKFNIKFVDNIRTAMFGGVGLFLASFEGSGKLLLHSISERKMASELYLLGLSQNKQDSQ